MNGKLFNGGSILFSSPFYIQHQIANKSKALFSSSEISELFLSKTPKLCKTILFFDNTALGLKVSLIPSQWTAASVSYQRQCKQKIKLLLL